MVRDALIEGVWERDPAVWTGSDEAQWLGWLDEPLHIQERLGSIRRFAESLHDEVDEPRRLTTAAPMTRESANR